jgi:hypothetical protein
MYNRYQGNSGRVERVRDAEAPHPPRPRPGGSPLPPPTLVVDQAAFLKRPPGPLHDLRSKLDGILSRVDIGKLETEDLLVLAILYLMYRRAAIRCI